MAYTAHKPYIPQSVYAEQRRALALTKRSSPPPLPRPTLGARIMAMPYIGDHDSALMPGTIDYIHETHHWYRVRFDMGFCQCYQWGSIK